MTKRIAIIVALMVGMVTLAQAQEAAPATATVAATVTASDRAPDELPTHLIKVLRTSNKAQTNRYIPKVYTINNVNPYDVFRWIRSLRKRKARRDISLICSDKAIDLFFAGLLIMGNIIKN